MNSFDIPEQKVILIIVQIYNYINFFDARNIIQVFVYVCMKRDYFEGSKFQNNCNLLILKKYRIFSILFLIFRILHVELCVLFIV